MTERLSFASVQHLGFAWFAMVMGLCGLSLAWSRAVPHVGPLALQVSLGLGVLAGSVFVMLMGLKRGLKEGERLKKAAEEMLAARKSPENPRRNSL